MSSTEEQFLYKEPLSPIGRTQSGLAALIVTPSLKKMDGNGDQAVDDEPFIDERKLSSMTAVRGVLSNGSSQKKRMELVTKLSMTNFSLTRRSHQVRRL